MHIKGQIICESMHGHVEINYNLVGSGERFCTLWDAVPHDFDIIIAVSSGLLMPETQSMKELMFDGGDAVTVCPNWQSLLPNSSVSHRGETTFGGWKKGFNGHNKSTMLFLWDFNIE